MKQNVNVLLIVCDQFRGDALSFANHPDVKTPYLDSLAADGVFSPMLIQPRQAVSPHGPP